MKKEGQWVEISEERDEFPNEGRTRGVGTNDADTHQKYICVLFIFVDSSAFNALNMISTPFRRPC